MAENVAGAGKIGCPATKMAKNVAGAWKIGYSATKTAENVAGAGKIVGSATKTAQNVAENDAQSLLGIRTRRPGHKSPYHL